MGEEVMSTPHLNTGFGIFTLKANQTTHTLTT